MSFAGKKMKYILHILKKHIEIIIFDVFKMLPLNEHRILFESEGDCTDNAYAFYDFLKRNGFFNTYEPIWLADYPKKVKLKEGCKAVKKFLKWISIKRLYYLATSKYFIYDHCNVLGRFPKRDSQRIINLWHGAAFKKRTVNLNGPEIDTEEMLTVTGILWEKIVADFVGCSASKAISIGNPRNDYLFSKNKNACNWCKAKGWQDFNKVIFWMPTFRRSFSSDISENYYQGETGLPICYTRKELDDLNRVGKELNVLFVFKVHHLQIDYPVFQLKYSNIQILKDEEISEAHLQLYQILPFADCLITDYSSIFNDYLLLDRPIIFTLDDYEDYEASRGFSIDNSKNYYPGYHVYNMSELINAIKEICGGIDIYQEKRASVIPAMHSFVDGNSSERIANYIGLSK